MEIIHLAHDELETLHLCDGEGKTQEEAGGCMGVSRGTVQRLLASARTKVAQALVGQKALAISGDMAVDRKITNTSERTAIGLGEIILRAMPESLLQVVE
jgi:predicted DNA-binding protein (UPF0251 family)